MPHRPVIHAEQILEWADAFKALHGRWPLNSDGVVEAGPGLTWCAVDQALLKGHRGLVRGQSLAKLLSAHRQKRHPRMLPPFAAARILDWVDAHRRETGAWPLESSGKVLAAPGETWAAVHKALVNGGRGLAGGSSLPQFLEAHRGVRNHRAAMRLTVPLILGWADVQHARTGTWPRRNSGPVLAAPTETWYLVDSALVAGTRGLPGGDSVAKALARCRGVRYVRALPPLTEERIRSWAAAHKARTGRWPAVKSGPVADAPGSRGPGSINP